MRCVTFRRLFFYFLVLALACVYSQPAHAKIEQIVVEADGVGATKHDAIMDAVVQAISNVNGAEIAAQTMRSVREQSSGAYHEGEDSLTESFQNDIKIKTNGVVDGWQVLSLREAADLGGVYVANISARISKFQASRQLDRLRMAVGGFTVSEQVNQNQGKIVMKAFVRELQDYLTQTRKFAMLEREMMAAQIKELDYIASGGFAIRELARLGNRVGADYIIVGEVEKASLNETRRTMQTTGKTFTFSEASGRVSFRIVEVATTQVKFSDSVGVTLKKHSLGDVGARMADIAGERVLNAIFPIRVLELSGKRLILGQGGDTVRANSEYKLIKLGKQLIDPYTKEVLGHEEVEIGTVKVVTVQAKSSVAEIIKSEIDLTTASGIVLIVRPLEKNLGSSVPKQKKVKEIESSGMDALDAIEKESNDEW